MGFRFYPASSDYPVLEEPKCESGGFSMTLTGIITGAASFAIIGLFHPIVIKAEYRFSKKIWPAFLLAGLLLLAVSLFLPGSILPAIVGVAGFSSLWSIRELYEQEQRVQRGWFPRNPNRK